MSGNPAATAANILASRYLWRAGIAGDLLMHVCDVGLMLVFYVLLRPVNRNLAIVAVLFNLVATSVLVVNAGICYVLNSFAHVAYPPIASRLFPLILLPPFVAELSLALWLLVKGVDLRTWPAASITATARS